eukprot:scaffold172182_cov21-Tisochrysis_lutea.AAC.1
MQRWRQGSGSGARRQGSSGGMTEVKAGQRWRHQRRPTRQAGGRMEKSDSVATVELSLTASWAASPS